MQLQRLFDYDDWANREEVTRLREIGAPPPALRLLAHVIGAEWLWLERLGAGNSRLAVWPELTIEQCASEVASVRKTWLEMLPRLDAQSSISYRNSKGEPWSSTVDEVLMHVIVHGAYHRGQIATLVRQGGETPAYTDLIHACRTGAI